MHSSRIGTTGRTASGPWRFTGGTWTVLCAVAAVLIGPAAATASALDQANKAPLHHAERAAQQTQGHLPADDSRKRDTA
jgi:hypothetical protein